jgi:outer membrane protein OmpA-like peptidoglycan-associated protein
MTSRMKFALLSGLFVFCMVNVSCATKKDVREAIAPVQDQANKTRDQVDALQKQADAHKQAIGDLDREVATAGEKATDADKKATEAAEAAAKANAAAAEASRAADAAAALAHQVEQEVSSLNQSLQNYKLVSTEQVFFGISQSSLSNEEHRKLDGLAEKIVGMKDYIVEVEGYTDSIGDKMRNRELGAKRADAVVHCLSVEHAVSLRVIRQLGVGSDFPGADNSTREARRLNRRVELKIYVRDLTSLRPSGSSD